jgi:hypothetical protein
MLLRSKRILVFLFVVVFAVVYGGKPVSAQEPAASKPNEPGLMAADLVLARPVGAVATVAGFVLFLVATPFSALGGNTRETWEGLVVSPANYTFQRPLGHFEEKAPVYRE